MTLTDVPLAGSCALLAMLDTSNRNLYVACTGDSRAVAGFYEETADGQGVWRVEALTEDQTGRNPNELKRYDIILRPRPSMLTLLQDAVGASS